MVILPEICHQSRIREMNCTLSLRHAVNTTYTDNVGSADIASLHGCNLLGQRRSSCRGAKTCHAAYGHSNRVQFMSLIVSGTAVTDNISFLPLVEMTKLRYGHLCGSSLLVGIFTCLPAVTVSTAPGSCPGFMQRRLNLVPFVSEPGFFQR
jgi:hypothetical protein